MERKQRAERVSGNHTGVWKILKTSPYSCMENSEIQAKQ